MGVSHRLMTWCFIFQLFLLSISETEASKNIALPKIEESNLDLSNLVSQIEAKDRQQDGEIVLLKNALDEERKLVHDLTNRVAILEGSNKNSARPKRPVRLLPPHILRGKEKNETDADDGSQFRFYGPATGCNDLGRLGYTLNGLYLVHEKENKSTNTSSSSNIRQIEIVECRFRLKPKLGNQTTDDKERRLGFICLSNGNTSCHSKESDDKERGLTLERIKDSNNLQPSRSGAKGDVELKEADTNKKKVSKKPQSNNKVKMADTEGGDLKETEPNKKTGSKKPKLNNKVKRDLYSKEADTERGLQFDRTNDRNNMQPSRSDGKENFDLKEADDEENELQLTTRINKVKSSSNTQPRSEVKQYCRYKLKSDAHQYTAATKDKNMCLVAEERKSKKNGSIITTNEPEYYLAQIPCNYVNDEEQWTTRNKHICSNKNDMCLTVSPNIKDGGVLLNLLAYEESAKSQQWIVKKYETYDQKKRLFTITNVGTAMCLFDPMDNKGKRKAVTTVKKCPTDYTHLEYLFYFEKINSMNLKNCSPF